ncbi:MAG TPA: dihydropteroate synthase [Clostridiales bacterium]|nr:dihydropteroate synthase [Clostridiales bacterium]
MDFQRLLNKPFVILDGAMGTMLQKLGLPAGGHPEAMNITHPEMVEKVHRGYIESGADIIYTNTFGANRYKLQKSGYTPEEVISAGIKAARKAAEGTGCLVALDIGPIGQLLEPSGTLDFEEAVDIFAEQVKAGVKYGADLIAIETMTDLGEARAAVLAAKENSSLPVICTMTFEKSKRTFTGCTVSAMALTLEGLGADAIGINCSLGPDELKPLVEELAAWTSLPIIVKPNAGLPDPVTGEYKFSPENFAKHIADLVPLGIKIVGGCCGSTPDTIAAVRRVLDSASPAKREVKTIPAVCSAVKTVPLDSVRVVGERINPTGKKLFKQALLRQDIDYIIDQAIDQVDAGAEILDVNVGIPEIDEKQMMVKCVKALQSMVRAPLQIDSSDPAVIEAGLRVYHGKAIVNSVNGDEESLDSVLPIVKKYGAAVIGLTLDKSGIPKTAKQRFQIAERILNRALEYGIPRESVFIDCLTLTASAEQEGASETLKAVRMCKEKLGLKTVLGVSNISFGLPRRELLNQTFLTLALAHGLDLPIINPNAESMMNAVRAFRLLYNIDKGGAEYIRALAEKVESEPPANPAGNTQGANLNLGYAVENGLKDEAAQITEKLLETTDPMQIIDTCLIPALDRVGADFEKGRIFLPQLIYSAGAAQAAFEAIKTRMSKSSGGEVSKGKIVLATVKGDIHDIGKNIVKVMLENYGYTVIDLGRDVDYNLVLDAAVKHDADIVGLSALMTTTLKSMEKTIALLKEHNVKAKIMVGGAVMTADYAGKIGADYYARDAKEAVDIAKKVIG